DRAGRPIGGGLRQAKRKLAAVRLPEATPPRVSEHAASRVISVPPAVADMSACTAAKLLATPLPRRIASCAGSNPAIVSLPKLRSLKSNTSGPAVAVKLRSPSAMVMIWAPEAVEAPDAGGSLT